jgi:hypothetical protein
MHVAAILQFISATFALISAALWLCAAWVATPRWRSRLVTHHITQPPWVRKQGAAAQSYANAAAAFCAAVAAGTQAIAVLAN